jgi:hypothetical protein
MEGDITVKMNDLSQSLGILNLFLLVCSAVGGFFALRHARKVAIIEIQKDTIEALQAQIDTLKDRQEGLECKNSHLEHIISTITDALKARGIIVTVDGDLVTITDADGIHSIKRSPTNPLAKRRPSQQQKKKEE